MDSQDPKISLGLECTENLSDKLTFTLTLTNESTQRLLFPYPKITGLQFFDLKSGLLIEWRTHLMIHGRIETPVWEGRESKLFQYSVNGTDRLSDGRWGIKLRKGTTYKVWYVLTVNNEFFDGDSHWRLTDLEKEAVKQGVRVWTGRMISNPLQIER